MTLARRKSPAPIHVTEKPAESTVIAQGPNGTVRMDYHPELPAIKVSIQRPAMPIATRAERRRPIGAARTERATVDPPPLTVGDIVSWRQSRREPCVLPVGEIKAIERPTSTVWIATYEVDPEVTSINIQMVFRRLHEIGIASQEELCAFASFRSQYGLALAAAEKARAR